MSSSPLARQMSQGRDIPFRKVVLNDASQMPNDYSTTPGGTIFSTTPGGTRIIYERSFLIQMRKSPMSNTPPSNLPMIPGVTSPLKGPNKPSPLIQPNSPDENADSKSVNEKTSPRKDRKPGDNLDEPQFEMDI